MSLDELQAQAARRAQWVLRAADCWSYITGW